MRFVNQNQIRTLFSQAMSRMYRQEVPQYAVLTDLVERVNTNTLTNNSALFEALKTNNNLARLSEEKHGAIRLGKAEELKTMCALFNVMGMFPVGYYDLSTANIPVHSTAFRPLETTALEQNAFRIFTSLLRIDLIQDEEIADFIRDALSQREIFSSRLRELISIHEKQKGLTESQAVEFVDEALNTFRWHKEAIVSHEDYQKLKSIHSLVADIVSFKGPHINHLTPRILDIDLAQEKMSEYRMDPKAIIEGPPRRNVPILLRQTSFRALEEPILFQQENGNIIQDTHRARFGEIEQRGIALKPKGLALFHHIMENVRQQIKPKEDGSNAQAYYSLLEKAFRIFPDDVSTLRKENLIYGVYKLTEAGKNTPEIADTDDLELLIANGYVYFEPTTYEDFLPISAAGIFTSNLDQAAFRFFQKPSSKQEFEMALGRKTIDPNFYYEKLENESIHNVLFSLHEQVSKRNPPALAQG